MRAARAIPVVLLFVTALLVLRLAGITDFASLRAALGLAGDPATLAPEDLDEASEVASWPAPELAGRAPRPRGPESPESEANPSGSGAQEGDPAKVGLTGVVVRADGKPAVGARVEVIGPDGRREVVLTDAEGRFRAEVVPGRYDLQVRAGLDGWAYLADVWVDGRPLSSALELSTAVTVRVEAYLDGPTLSGAPVRMRWTPPGGGTARGVADGVTDRDGVLEVEGLPPGAYSIEVDAAPTLTGVRSLQVTAQATVVVRFPALGRWTGRVVDAGDRTPLPATVVLTVNLEGGYARGAAVADARGRFEVVVPRGTPRQVFVEHEGYVPYPSARREAQPALAALGALRRDDVVFDVELRRGLALAGVVIGADTKEPVEGVAIDLRRSGWRPSAEVGATPARATSGPDGVFEVHGASPGTWTAVVVSPGWYQDGEARVHVAAPTSGDATPRMEVHVRGAGRVTGRVVRESGLPVAGARVWLFGGGGVVRGARAGGRPLETIAGPDGGFVLDDVPPLLWLRVRASLGDLEAVPSPAFRLVDGVPAPMVLALRTTGAVVGRVADLETRDPVAGARVRLDAVGEPEGRGTRTTNTDAAGRYEFKGLIPGEWRATPERRGLYLSSTGSTTRLEPGVEEVDLPLFLDPGLSVVGVVVDAAGARVSGARLTLTGTEDGATQVGRAQQNARSGSDGSFRLVALRSGLYTIEIRSGSARARVDGLRGGERGLVITVVR